MKSLLKLITPDAVEEEPKPVNIPYEPSWEGAVGDWPACKAAMAIKGASLEFKRQRCRQYLGTRIRAQPKHSMVFTPSYLVWLATENRERREAKFPYYAKLASLYLEIEALESIGV